MINENDAAAAFVRYAQTLDVLSGDDKIEVVAITITSNGLVGVFHNCDSDMALFMISDALFNYHIGHTMKIPRQDN